MNRRIVVSAASIVAIGASMCGSFATARAAGPAKVYVDTLRIVEEKGPERPELTVPLIALLKTRGYEVLEQRAAETSDVEAFRLTRLVLLKSKLQPPGFGVPGSSDMEVQGFLVTPQKVEHKLGPFSTHTAFEQGDFVGTDVTPKGLRRVLTEAFLPLVNAMAKLTP